MTIDYPLMVKTLLGKSRKFCLYNSSRLICISWYYISWFTYFLFSPAIKQVYTCFQKHVCLPLIKLSWSGENRTNQVKVGLKLLTHLRLGLSHLNEHRLNHNFQNCIHPLCSCILEIESISNFLLHCYHYANIHITLLNSISEIIGNTFNINDECLVNSLLLGSQKYIEIDNSHIVNATIKHLLDSGRFNGPVL